MFGDERPELADQLRANVSRFSAYKAAYVRRELDSVAADGTMTEEERKAMTKATISQFSRWTDAEMTTATARARTAKQFSEYNDPDRKELFPCLRWLPSRSAVPRSTHRRFYDRVWSKDDNFWKTNQPGTEWNCKCDIEETDDPATDNSDIEQPPVPKGLEGNPAKTGEVFTDNASYIRDTRNKEEVEHSANIIDRENYLRDKELFNVLTSQKGTCVDKEGNTVDVEINKYGYRESLGKMVTADFLTRYWKDEIVKNWTNYVAKGLWVGRAPNNMEHNSLNNKRNRWKIHCDYFDYYEVTAPNGMRFLMNIIHHTNGKSFLWAVTTDIPSY